MVTRKTPTTRRTRRPAAVEPPMAAVKAPVATARHAGARTGAQMRKAFVTAGATLQTAGVAAGRFGRSAMREMTGAARASREPVHTLWRNVRLASRHIARDAVAMWHEVMPARAGAKRPARRAAA